MKYIHAKCMRVSAFLIVFMVGRALREHKEVMNGGADVQEIASLPKSSNDSLVIVKGYYWPSYEGSVLCQTKEFENCLVVVLSEKAYKNYAGRFKKSDFVAVRGRFEWVDIDEMKKNFAESNMFVPFYPYHRIIDVSSIELVN